MWVVDRKNLQVINVPDNYRECSICLEWKPESDFMNEGENFVSRTNCHDCYMLPHSEFLEKREKAAEYKKSFIGNGKLRITMRALELERKIRKDGISKEDLKNWFDNILNSIPDNAIIDCTGGDIQVEQSFMHKPLFQLKFSEYGEDSGFFG